MIEALQSWASRIKRDAATLRFAARHPDTPRAVKVLGACALAYALSPIDLIPDAVPVIGLLDDAIIVPALIWLAIRWTPEHVLAQSRAQADRWVAERGAAPKSRLGAAFVVGIWLLAAVVLWRAFRTF